MFLKCIKKMGQKIDNNMEVFYVVKRTNEKEEVSFDKIIKRIKNLSNGLNINPTLLAQKIIQEIYDGIKTSEIDELAAQLCASLSTEHPDYLKLASRIEISNLHKNTSPSFSETIGILYENRDIHDNHCPLICQEVYDIVNKNKTKLNSYINYENDGQIDYFGLKTLEKSYLMKVKGKIIERPQHMFMRVSLGIHQGDIKEALKTYDMMSQKYFIHATPTLFNAGTRRPQLSSCFLLAMKDDSIDGIYSTLRDCALISKWAGGIGLNIHNIRASRSLIRGTNGISNGLVPMLRVFNNTARYVDQCVHPETIIYTTRGPMKIQDVSLGETEIFNLSGNTETIQNVLEHPYDGNVFNIKVQHCIDNLMITDEHPLFVLRGQKKGTNYSVIQNRLDKNLVKFDWVEVKELTTDDMIAFPIPTFSNDINTLNADDCYVYGVILGDGCMNNTSDTGYVSLHSTKKNHILDKLINYFNNKYIEFRTEINENTTRIYWKKTINMPFRYNDVYDSSKEKYIHHKWLNLPIEKSKYILKGLIDTDGCIANELVFDSTSRNLIESVRYICLRMGILTSGYIRDRVGETHKGLQITNQKISYCLRIPKTQEICRLLDIEYKSEYFKFFRYNNLLCSRISEITQSEYQGTLYDLQMKNEHNYLIHNGLVHNGGGKRNGSIAMYIEPWHSDIFEFLDMRKNTGNEEERARDLFYALWIPDLFMERVAEEGNWTLMCPDECPGLADCWGDEFNALYTKYENEGRGKKTIPAIDLWYAILESQVETGTPYMLYKDAANGKSNQQNLGTIKSSNLCTEIIEYSSSTEYAVCNLASIGLSRYVIEDTETITNTENMKIYTIENCKYCRQSKALLEERDVKYETICVADADKSKVLDELDSGSRTYPQIFVGDEFVGGFSELVEYLRPKRKFDFDALHKNTKIVTRNLNKIIDLNFYPVPETERSNRLHRPIGLGVQGLADVFAMLHYPFNSEEARELNEKIFETIYLGAVEASVEISKKREAKIIKYKEHIEKGETEEAEEMKRLFYIIPEEINRDKFLGSYSSFIGSPASEGKLQFDLWDYEPSMKAKWNKIKRDLAKYGMRNSLLVAPMPTASTSQILGNNECFEPFTSNMYVRRTLAGEFIVINKHLIQDLIDLNLWDTNMKNKIITENGSVQNIPNIPDYIKNIYKTVWEIGNKTLIDMATDRARFICQSQSLNLFMAEPDYDKMTSMHFYAWRQGLKTGQYYLRTKPAASAQQFSIEPEQECESCSA
jgi:ribonucleoside-diphosphate reductase alpha chain